MKKNRALPVIYIVFACVARLLPHPANFTPCINICLFAGSTLSRKTSFAITMIMLLLSDVMLAKIYGYPVISAWSCFTYSGFMIIVLLGSKFLRKPELNSKLLLFVISVSFGFWLWTNFGVWLTSGIYAKSISGFISCYIAALPFLRNSLFGDLSWMLIIFGTYQWFLQQQLCEGHVHVRKNSDSSC